MSKLKKPAGFFDQDNNQEKEITAKRLGDQEAGVLGYQDTKRSGDQGDLPQNDKETSTLGDEPLNVLSDKEIIPQTIQEINQLDDKTPKSQKAQKLDSQTSKCLDAVTLGVHTLNQLEVEPLNGNTSDLPVDETLKQSSVEETKPLEFAAPKKKAKSASLVKKTYYIDHDLDGAIELMAVLQKSDQSDIIRKILRSAIPEYYLTQWKAMCDHSK